MILLVDNYDSFTYNLFQYLRELGAEVVVRRNDAVSVAEARGMGLRAVVISPGPGRPADAGVSRDLILELGAGDGVPVLGCAWVIRRWGRRLGRGWLRRVV